MTTQHDLVGIGFGPAAIAVATAIEDDRETDAAPLSCRFLERAPSSAWQPNMLLPGTDIQHHFLRDFATPRDPRSRFTFPSYLVDTGRFYPFTNLGGYVSRHEWSAYVRWVTDQLAASVRYDAEVVEVAPVLEAGTVVAARVTSRDTGTGARSTHLTRNVLVSVGHQPHVPDEFAPAVGPTLFHSAEFLARMAALPTPPRRVAVVGAGQNAGEILLYLANALPRAEIHSLVRNSGFRMYNLGHFSNEAYFPAETDYFYGLDGARREKVFGDVHSTNYASVDPDVSTALYRAVYDDRQWGPGRLHMRKRTAVESVTALPGGAHRLGLREVNTGATGRLEVDLVVLCTGFTEPRLPAMLEPFAEYVVRDENGDPAVSREFRLGTTPVCDVGVYLNGITEWRHGINSATSFSTLALKAADILRDLRRRPTARTNGHAALAARSTVDIQEWR